MSGDGHARLSESGCEVLIEPDQGGVVFLDLSFVRGGWDRAVGALRSIPPHLVGETSALIVRSPVTRWKNDLKPIATPGSDWPDSPDELADRIRRHLSEHRLPTRTVGAFELPVGAAPVAGGAATSELLARCRAVELWSYLARNAGIWTPNQYHYQLPSGHHAGAFVRIADALKDPLAAPALATWLYGYLTDSTSVVVDSGTLMPIVAQLDYILQRASIDRTIEGGLVAVEALDKYPLSKFEYSRRFKAIGGTDVLALLSVSSTGETFRYMASALDATAPEWKALCFVARGRQQARELEDPIATGIREAWLGLDSLGPTYSPGEDCPMCRDSARPQVVHINPRSFAAMALPEPVLVMPDIRAAQRNASLFQWYQDAENSEGPLIQLTATEQSRIRANPFHRPLLSSKVRFEPLALLLDEDDLTTRVRDRLREISQLSSKSRVANKIRDAAAKLTDGQPTLAICDGEEISVLSELLGGVEDRQPGLDRFLALAKAVCPTVTSLVAADDENLESLVAPHASILLVVAGVQTGVTLQHLLVACQDALRSKQLPDITMQGLVLHAHPGDSDAWGSVRNSFGGKADPSLLALWLTYLPGRSPLDRECDLISIVQEGWLPEATDEHAIWERRQQWLASQSRVADADADADVRPDSPLLSPNVVTLRRTSLFGDLSDRALVVAMGAALHEAFDSHRSDGNPEWVRVDLPNAMRSYFDALLHVALLRWTAPERAWWGSGNECTALIGEMRARFDYAQEWPFLLAELLMAAALGKVPKEGSAVLIAYAKEDIESADLTHRPYLRMAMAFAQNLTDPPPPGAVGIPEKSDSSVAPGDGFAT